MSSKLLSRGGSGCHKMMKGREKFPELVLRVVVQFIQLNESGRDETTLAPRHNSARQLWQRRAANPAVVLMV